MRKMQLIHPRLGVWDEKSITGKYTKSKIIKDWRHRYGKVIDRCEIKEIFIEHHTAKRVIETTTWMQFETIGDAAKHFGIHKSTIASQLNKSRISKIKYKFEAA